MKKLFIIFLILNITIVSFAADKIILRKLGGLNTRANPYELQDYEASDISNFTLDTAGSITERNLFKKYTNTSVGSTAITTVYKFYKSSDVGYLICASGTKLYKAASGSLTNISNTGISVTSDSQWAFETFTDGTNELAFGANTGAVLQSWNGTDSTFSSEGGYPATNCNILKKHKARLWAAGSTSVPYRIYYSSLSDGDDWTTSGGSFDLPAYEKIMALEVLGDVLYAFTRIGIYAIVGDTPNEFYIIKTASKVGTHSFKSVVLGGNLIYFLNKAGVFVFDGSESTNISENIQPTIDSISNTYIGTSAGLYDKRGRYWLSYTSTNGSYNDTIIIYDTVVKQWYKFNNVNFSSFFKAEGGTDKGEIFAGCSNPAGFLWQLQTSSSLEQITHSTETQLASGVTFNTAVLGTEANPAVELNLWGGGSYDANLKLLLHLDGADGATSTTDYGNGHAVTFTLGAALDTAFYKLGTASATFNGTLTYLQIPDSTDWDVAASSTDNWTIDLWVRHSNLSLDEYYIDQWQNADNHWHLLHYAGSGLKFQVVSNGAALILIDYVSPITDSNWHHIAVCKVGSNWGLYKDGIQIGYTSDSDTKTINGDLYIGSLGVSSVFEGNLDEIRITNNNAFNASPVVGLTDKIAVPQDYCSSGTLISDNLQINASGQSSLSTIKWSENLPSNTDIQFTTRTGTTDDTVDYNGWETWVSTSTVIDEITSPTVWASSDAINFTTANPASAQARDILYYETDDSVSPNCVQFTLNNALSTNDYAEETIPSKDLSNYKFIGFWLKSPTTGNAVKLDIGNVTSSSVGYVTANSVAINTWEYHYWPVSVYSSSDINDITKLRITYLGDGSGTIYLGDIYAYDFLDSTESISSTPNDWIQYKAVLGSTDKLVSPQLISSNNFVVTLSYTTTAGSSENTLTSYWQSKRFDMGQPNYNKKINWAEMTLLSNNPTTNHTVSFEYELDGGSKTGTVTGNVVVTGNTTKLKFYFPSGTYGRDFMFKIEDDDVDDDLRIDNVIVDYNMEASP